MNAFRDADGAVLVYDVTDAESFQKVRNWVKELRRMLGSNIRLAIAGNKVGRRTFGFVLRLCLFCMCFQYRILEF